MIGVYHHICRSLEGIKTPLNLMRPLLRDLATTQTEPLRSHRGRHPQEHGHSTGQPLLEGFLHADMANTVDDQGFGSTRHKPGDPTRGTVHSQKFLSEVL